VSRLPTKAGDAMALGPVGDDTLVNISVWRDVESLQQYMYKSATVEVMRRRNESFVRARKKPSSCP
jgi:Domain of unknown function (DUF3291)